MKKLIAILGLTLASCNQPAHNSTADQKVKGPILLDPVTVEAAPYTREELLTPVFSAMLQQEKEGLPFDEPKHEYGRQLDGKLRPYWVEAYFKKQRLYAYIGDTYHTMNGSAPFIPQVCADFIVDTIDRAAGTWYNPDLKHPKHVVGKFDFRKQMESEKFNPRNADHLIKYFGAHPDDFKIIFEGTYDADVGNVANLKDFFQEKEVQIGDIVIIRGRAPWDHGKEIHWHSFFVTRLDEQGKVSMLMGNAGKPREWSLEREVARAPKRKVVGIIRMTNHFLGKMQ